MYISFPLLKLTRCCLLSDFCMIFMFLCWIVSTFILFFEPLSTISIKEQHRLFFDTKYSNRIYVDSSCVSMTFFFYVQNNIKIFCSVQLLNLLPYLV